jgi:phosphomevalonate kinase
VIRASAPGKLVLMGEYAVLHGHPAIVAAVDVRAVCRREGGPLEIERDEGGLINACLQVAGEVDGQVVVDTSAFRSGSEKYGLGSSAAACVALLRALLPHVQLDELHALAQKAHRNFQRGRGSGVDVCASVYGGIQRFVRISDDVTEVEAMPSLPAGLRMLPVWTGVSADTRAFLGRVEAAPDVAAIFEDMAHAAASFEAALFDLDAFRVVESVRWAARVLDDLGHASGCDIISLAHRQIEVLMREVDGAAKPSGAGGGDVALCFLNDDDDLERDARALLEAEGFRVLDLLVGAPGVDVVGDGA